MKTKVFTLLLAIATYGVLNAQLIPSWEHNGIYYENLRDTTVIGEAFPGHIVKVSTKYENDSPNGTMGSARMVFGVYSGDIVIPSDFTKSGSHYFVEEIGSCAFQFCDITSISMPNSIKQIDQNAFHGCMELHTIEIPDGVEIIGETAFNRCSSLENVKIGKNLKTIADDAFYDCYKIKNVIWNAFWCARVSPFLFSGALESITFGDDVAYVPANICAGKNKLNSVIMSDNVTIIGEQAFYGCENLIDIHFPNALNQIDSKAFANTGLWCITIPELVYSVKEDAFMGSHPVEVHWNVRSSGSGIGYVDFGSSVKRIYFGDKVEMIPPLVCKNNTHLEEVYIPASVTTIRESAFYGCTALRKLSMGEGVENIGKDAFYNCSNLSTALVLPNGLKKIESNAFYGCSKIPSITINSSIESIGTGAFYGCAGLRKVYNFSSFVLVPHATTYGHVAYYADIVCNDMELLGDYVFSQSLKYDAKYQLVGYTGTSTDIALPATYKSSTYAIEQSAFRESTQLTSVTISEAVTIIREGAFYKCTGITSLSIPTSVTSIGQGAFEECTNINEIYCESQMPPTAYANTFKNVPTSATLYIPAGSLSAYQNAPGWNHFTNIVETNLVNVSGVSLNATTLNIRKGEEVLLRASVVPANATYKTVIWSTSDSTIAKVSNGVVYGKKAGTAIITCTTTNGGYSATCEVTVVAASIPATGFQFYKYAANGSDVYVPYSEMQEGDTLTFMELGTGYITIDVLPYSVTNGEINWRVSDPSIISTRYTEHINFANSLKIEPLHVGTTKITISTTDGTNISKSVYVKITPDPTVKVIGVRCLTREITIGKGEKDTLDALVLPLDATETYVSWGKAQISGGNPLSINVRTVESNRCEITAKSVGTAYVYVETYEGKYKDTCKINIINKVPVTGLSLNQTSKTLKVGETLQLTPVFAPSNATNKNVYWSMDNDSVATIENGLITAIRLGSVTVNCTSEEGNFTASCSITVQEDQQPPVTEAITVRLKASSVSWSKVNLYYWADGIDSPAWPGTTITQDAQGWYAYTIPASVTSVNIIWNDGNNQTTDITNITQSTCYKLNSTSGKSITVSTINCEEDIVAVTGVTLNKKTLQISKGGNHTLTATVLPANATNKTVTWSSSNTSVATVSNTGKITAKTAGVSTISCETVDGHFKAECYIVVTDASQGCDYSFEPTAASVIQFEATDLSFSAFDGGSYVILTDAEHSLYLMYYGSLVNGALPAGEHPVSSIEQNGNILYSIGGDDSYDYGSFMATNFTADGSYSAAYYIIAGNMSVGTDNGIYAKLVSVNGTDIIVTYRWTQDVEIVPVEDGATKILRDNQIFIFRGEKVYTLQGAEVR